MITCSFNKSGGLKMKSLSVLILSMLMSSFAFGSVAKVFDGVPFTVDQSAQKLYFWKNSQLISRDVLSGKDQAITCGANVVDPKNLGSAWISNNLLLIYKTKNEGALQAWFLDAGAKACRPLTGAPAQYSLLNPRSPFYTGSVAVDGDDVYLSLERSISATRSKYLIGNFNAKTGKFALIVPETTVYLTDLFIHPSKKLLVVNGQSLSAPDYQNYFTNEVWFIDRSDLKVLKTFASETYRSLRYIPTTSTNQAVIAGESCGTDELCHNEFYEFVNLNDFSIQNRTITSVGRINGFDVSTSTAWGGRWINLSQVLVIEKPNLTSTLSGYGFVGKADGNGSLLAFVDVGTANDLSFDLYKIDLATGDRNYLPTCGTFSGMPTRYYYGTPTYSISTDDSQVAYTYVDSLFRRIYARDIKAGTCRQIDLDYDIVKSQMPTVKFIGSSTDRVYISSPAGVYVGTF